MACFEETCFGHIIITLRIISPYHEKQPNKLISMTIKGY